MRIIIPIAVLNPTQFGCLPTFNQPNNFLILRNSTFFSYNCCGVATMKFQFNVGNTMKFIWKYKKRKRKNKLISSFCRNKSKLKTNLMLFVYV